MADPGEIEIELGHFNLERTKGEHTFIVPKVVLNYGIIKGLEIVGEFGVAKPPDDRVQVVGPGLFLKTVLKEGVLQDKEGIGFAVEAGPLFPSTVQGERKLGFEGIGILSGKLTSVTYHVNVGGGVQRDGDPVAIWGAIVEVPILQNLRVVGEVNGEKARREVAKQSVLLGCILQPTSSHVSLDAGIRRGISGSPEWAFTMGVTFSFPVAASGKSK